MKALKNFALVMVAGAMMGAPALVVVIQQYGILA